MNTEKHVIDLRKFYSCAPDYRQGISLCKKENKNYNPVDNEFGWDVSYAEVYINSQTQELSEYKLLSKNGTEQSHAVKKTKKLTYWHFEFLDRQLNVSPDPFEPQLQTFLKYYYREKKQILNEELSFPIVSYAITRKKELVRVRYALFANQMYTIPLFHILVLDGYLTAITDWQNPDEMKNIAFPIPNHDRYLIQNKKSNQIVDVDKIQEKFIRFQGFNDYQIKYRLNSETEKILKKYDFFVPELINIINDSEKLLKYIPTINYHLIKCCNMKCRHCFSDFNEIPTQLQFEEAKTIIQEIVKIKSFNKLNFSGGEPTMFPTMSSPNIERLIDFAKKQGLETSMVTNGYNLIKKPDTLKKLKGHLDLLTLSIDSFDHNLNVKIGRCVGEQKQTLSYEDFLNLTQKCEEYGIKIKVNTVVSKLNYNQILANKIAKFKPIRWKILRILPIKSQNDEAKEYIPTDEEYKTFVENNKEIAEKAEIKVVAEDNEDMTGSYLMISPDGKFFNNIEGCHKYSESILEGIEKALQQVPLRREIFYKRDGDYSCD